MAAGKPYVIRLRSDGKPAEKVVGDDGIEKEVVRRVKVKDAIRGTLSFPENYMDTVILKTTGIPTYHFAHVVDDHLMRTTHVVRGAEWLSSLPIHVELFEKLGWEMPVYCHTAQLMKIGEDGNKRKLSKRKDPELGLGYYKELGYFPEAVREYLMTILNSDYEEWRMANPDLPLEDFPFEAAKMSSSGTLFDLNKLNDISKDVLSKKSAEEIYEFELAWAKEYAPEKAALLAADPEKTKRIFDIDRGGEKPRKDLIYAQQIFQFISYFFDETFTPETDMPAECSAEDIREIFRRYKEGYSEADDNSAWFEKIRAITADLGYAVKPKDYKKNPDQYKGHVGHVSNCIRIALTGRSNSPDLWTIQQIMGKEQVFARLDKAEATLQ